MEFSTKIFVSCLTLFLFLLAERKTSAAQIEVLTGADLTQAWDEYLQTHRKLNKIYTFNMRFA